MRLSAANTGYTALFISFLLLTPNLLIFPVAYVLKLFNCVGGTPKGIIFPILPPHCGELPLAVKREAFSVGDNILFILLGLDNKAAW